MFIPLRANLQLGAERDPDTDCLIWQRATNSQGDPVFKDAEGAQLSVRREVFRQYKRLTEAQVYMHKIRSTCDNQLCINPVHLFDQTKVDRAKANRKRHDKAYQAKQKRERAERQAEIDAQVEAEAEAEVETKEQAPRRRWEGVFFSSYNNWHCEALGKEVTFPTAHSAAEAHYCALNGLDWEIPPRPPGQKYAGMPA